MANEFEGVDCSIECKGCGWRDISCFAKDGRCIGGYKHYCNVCIKLGIEDNLRFREILKELSKDNDNGYESYDDADDEDSDCSCDGDRHELCHKHDGVEDLEEK